MFTDIIPFSIEINTALIAGACLWALALYVGLSRLKDWFIEKLNLWFNFAERFMYTSQQEFDRTRPARESQNAFYASLFSIIPFLAIGILCDLAIEWGLGRGWSVSMGLLACIGCAIYELGKLDGENS
ncbi:MAG: hypothetical protein N5P05_000337 [Chroococcopsis gigantea SAG 12.99]|jgi:hypothetical protein|nr:hypothetical protein [Chroococcopsis gigantea SAG 12.99]